MALEWRIYKFDGFSNAWESYITPPASDPTGIAFDTSGNLLSVDYNSDVVYRHNGFSTSILTQFNILSGTGETRGVTFDGTNAIALHDNGSPADIVVHYTGFTSSVVRQYGASSSKPSGLTYDGTDIFTTNFYTAQIYRKDFITGTLQQILNAPASTPTGLAWDGTYLIVACQGDDRVYRINKSTGDVISNVYVGGLTGFVDLYGCAWWNGDLYVTARIDTATVPPTPPTPVADFTGSPTSGDAPLVVNFTNLSTGASSYSWSFPSGSPPTSTAQNPTVTYSSAGSYTVSLTATGPGGSDPEVKNNYITATVPIPAPVAAFSGSPLSGDIPLVVTFTDSSTNATGWSWSFPGGNPTSSTAQNPTVTYSSAGTYDVSLTATGPGGSDPEVKNGYITANLPPAPVANFTGTPVSGLAPLVVDFADSSTNAPTGWSWSFEGGSPSVSTSQNPQNVTFTNPGTFNVTLQASNIGGSDDEIKNNYITVYEAAVANFSKTPSSGNVPLTVTLTNLSSGAISTWDWTFTGGVPASYSGENPPTVQYNSTGTFQIELEVSGDGGTDIYTDNVFVTHNVFTITILYETASASFAAVTGAIGDIGSNIASGSHIAYWTSPDVDRPDVEVPEDVKIKAVPGPDSVPHTITITNVTQLVAGDGTGSQGDVKIEYDIVVV